MTDQATHQMTQDHIQMLAALIRETDLEAFMARLNKSDTIGPLLDPTLYRDAIQSGKWDLLKEVARALLTAKQAIIKAEEAYEKRHGKGA